MKSPPVEDMFAELDSDDGNDPSTPLKSSMHETFGRDSRTGPKIVYGREELMRLRESPLVKKPEAMKGMMEWFG